MNPTARAGNLKVPERVCAITWRCIVCCMTVWVRSILRWVSQEAANVDAYIMLQFGEGQAHRLIGGAAWAYRGSSPLGSANK
jgi:hypothetical protein